MNGAIEWTTGMNPSVATPAAALRTVCSMIPTLTMRSGCVRIAASK